MAINPKIKQKAEDIRSKIFGSEVRESLASGIEAMSEDVEATIGRQDYVEEQFQDVLDETTGKDVISAPELIAARNGKSNLKTRLDGEHAQVTAQLQQIVVMTNLIQTDGVSDLTEELQSIIDSNEGNTILWNSNGLPYLTRQLNLRSNTTIIFSPETVVKAFTGFNTHENLFHIVRKDNIVIHGNFATIKMLKSEYTTGEWRNCISIFGSKNIRIYDLNIEDSGGDGIIVGNVWETEYYSENVIIQGCIFINHRRQGLSAVGGIYGLIIRDCYFYDTNGTLPQFGIDIEPNHNEMDNMDILIENCYFSNNRGGAIGVFDNSFGVKIRNCRDLSNDQFLIIKRLSSNSLHPTVTVENCDMYALSVESVDDVKIRNSQISFVNAQGVFGRIQGLILEGIQKSSNQSFNHMYFEEVNNLEVHNSQIENSSLRGIQLLNCPNFLINRVTFNNSGSSTQPPIHVTSSPDGVITKCKVRRETRENAFSVWLKGGGNARTLIDENDFSQGSLTRAIQSDGYNHVEGTNTNNEGVRSYEVRDYLPSASSAWQGKYFYLNQSGVYTLNLCVRSGLDTFKWVAIE
ncbi:right-handed parallel beta-helix repeat-containing protein [Jeotgalibaca porci]|uniref:right-handed parallel beta-helix repeat-containing protein n=1 Tax=Jeotgalibaca porci TaxID=1868793 RepID=UPI00359FA8BD